jgi:hypothetical protein
MDQLIATYLFAHKQCSLPGLGNLLIVNNIAENDFLNKKILAPQPNIIFSDKEVSANGLIQFIADKKNKSVDEVNIELQQYCKQIKSTLNENTFFSFAGIGNFSTAPGGKIQFSEQALPSHYLPVIEAERVVHPEAEHSILVGDKESTNTAMADYYNEEEPVKKSHWWIWAILLFCMAMAMLLTYFNGANGNSMFGNCTSIF